jgi:hypothetical protein
MNLSIGKWKFIFERFRGWLGIISLLLSVRMNILLSPIAWYWYPIGLIGALIIVYLDMRFIVSGENDTSARKNPVIMEILETVKRIEAKNVPSKL